MPAGVIFANNAMTTIAGPISSSATSVNLASGTGALFAAPAGGGQFFVATFYDAATKLITEIVHVISISGDVATIVRGQEGTTPKTWAAGDIFLNNWTAGSASLLAQLVTANHWSAAQYFDAGATVQAPAAAGDNSTSVPSTAWTNSAIAADIAAFLAAGHTWPASQTFSAQANFSGGLIAPAPSPPNDSSTQVPNTQWTSTRIAAFIAALLAGTNTWAASQTFAGGANLSGSSIPAAHDNTTAIISSSYVYREFADLYAQPNTWAGVQTFNSQAYFASGAINPDSPPLGDTSGLMPNTNWVYDFVMYPVVVPLSNANVTLSATQYGYGTIVFTGTLTANVNVTFPIRPGFWRVYNTTSGAYTVTAETSYAGSGGTSVVLPQGYCGSIYCDGAGNILLAENILLGTTNVWNGANDFFTDANATIVMKTRPAGDQTTAGANTLFVTNAINTAIASISAGRLLSDLLYATSNTYTFYSNSNIAYTEIGGGGGGGGGCAAAAAGQSSAGSGGGGGAVLRIYMIAPAGQSLATLIPAGFTVSIGAGGAGGTTGANNGSVGGSTTLTIGGNVYTANGGGAGIGGTSVPGPSAGGGGEGGAATFYSGTTVNGVSVYVFESSNGGVGGLSFVLGAGNSSAGYGGANGMGKPGALTTSTGSPGTAATNLGTGGSGANEIAGGGALSGGDGRAGYFRFTQYSV